ncbi:phosphoribulokinase [Teredinibacter haidensis]|uniref:phosphoribulokinase n=1 Tax=Teredinibacter haidensis TaxID=2731755 RepID=UPI000949170E|nr:phosphoribulokinase [Teredinibacter haidensis]
MQTYISDAIAQHGLPHEFSHTVNQWYFPLAQYITSRQKHKGATLVLGIQGTQGSGKSTLADFLRLIFEHEHGLACAVLSIDDFYLTRNEREKLAKKVHPLLSTRGVPGTHDINLAIKTINTLKTFKPGAELQLVRFDKAIDDRAKEADWTKIKRPVDIIILEGWCIGLKAQDDRYLENPINALEENEDTNAVWRNYVNQQLANTYPTLFKLLDCLAVLKAPSFNCVYQWRLLQEEKLKQRWRHLPTEQRANSHILSPEEVERFIAHYQRLTEHALNTLPDQADWTLPLDSDHNICDLIMGESR